MKNEIRVAANTAVENLLTAAMPNLIPVRVAKKDGYAIDTGMKDENGNTVYAVVEVTVKNTEATKTAPAFDLDAAIAARAENDNKPKKESKPKQDDPEAAAKREKREHQQKLVADWCMVNLTSEPMTTTDIHAAIPELAGVSIMQVGTYLKNVAADNAETIKREVVKGKPYYSRA
jgi:hypothetical protein